MKKILSGFIYAICVFCLCNLCFAEAKIDLISGSVTVNNIIAVVGQQLNTNDVIKTSEQSSSIILLNSHKIIVSQETEISISELTQGNSLLKIVLGKIRAKVNKLKAEQKFEVRTPTAIVAVRGTDVVVSANGELVVIEGFVEFCSLTKPEIMIIVNEGQKSIITDIGEISPPEKLTKEEKEIISKEWINLERKDLREEKTKLEKKERMEEKAKLERKDLRENLENDTTELKDLKNELCGIVSDIKTDVNVTREIVNEMKEGDFAVGRSLKDVHGNLVRVEQLLLRPNNQTLLFLNLTKRNSYVYNGKFSYDGPNGRRLDILEMRITFNKNLPEQLTKWPGFISKQDEDTFYPQSIHYLLSNSKDRLEFIGISKDKGDLDEEDKILTERRIVMNGYINGWKIDPNYHSDNPPSGVLNDLPDDIEITVQDGFVNDKDISTDGSKNGDLWATNISSKIRIFKDGYNDRFVNIFVESYGINNDGKILNLKDFINTSENPFTILKQIAVENILSVREGNTVSSPNFFEHGRNIDIIVTPDIIVAIIQKLATKASNIADSIK
ncbi:MAG: FecR family protein [Elusimicrobiota bacterium]